MVQLPADTPDTNPDGFIVAMPVLLLLHTPPVSLLERVEVLFAHNTNVPVILATVGKGLTETVVNTLV